MNIRFYSVAVMLSAALSLPAQAHSPHGGGSAPSMPAATASSRSSATAGPHYSAQRMNAARFNATRYSALHPYAVRSNVGRLNGVQSNVGRSNFVRSNAGRANMGNARVIAQHPANWQRNWSHNHDHWWHGHRCHFAHGSWFIYDLGFYDPFWYGYPYYGWGYPYSYDSGVYEGTYAGSGYDPSAGGSTVSAAQAQLAQEGYYHGEIDGVLGPQTRRALVRYQRAHGLRATGDVTASTLQNLGIE